MSNLSTPVENRTTSAGRTLGSWSCRKSGDEAEEAPQADAMPTVAEVASHFDVAPQGVYQ